MNIQVKSKRTVSIDELFYHFTRQDFLSKCGKGRDIFNLTVPFNYTNLAEIETVNS